MQPFQGCIIFDLSPSVAADASTLGWMIFIPLGCNAREVEKREKRRKLFPIRRGFEVRHLTPTLSPERRG